MPKIQGLAVGRRADLDWLRIIAIGLLIVTHTLVMYRTFEWRVHSQHAGEWGNLLGGALGPWRMSLVFLVGGAATRFLIEKRNAGDFMRERGLRLLVPFIFAVAILVPLETLALVDPAGGPQAYIQAFREHWTFPSHIILGTPLPDLGNAWFLPYLFVYGAGAALLWRCSPRIFSSLERRLGALHVFAVAGLLALAFFLADGVVAPAFRMTGALLNDPAGHVRFLTPFLLGLFLVGSPAFWVRLRSARFSLAAIAIPLLAASLWFLHQLTSAGAAASDRDVLNYTLAESLFGAAAIFTILAFASRWLRKSNRTPASKQVFSYLSDAILPVYLMHQAVIMLMAGVLTPLALPLIVEFGTIAGSALLAPLLIYHVAIRPYGPMRFLFGLKPAPSRIHAPHPAPLQPAAA